MADSETSSEIAACALDRRERIVQLAAVLQREGWRVRVGHGYRWDTLSMMGVPSTQHGLVAFIAKRYAGPDTPDVRPMGHGTVLVRYVETMPPVMRHEPSSMDYVNLYDLAMVEGAHG